MHNPIDSTLTARPRQSPTSKSILKGLSCIIIITILFFTYACQTSDKQKKAKSPYKNLFKKKGQYTQGKLPYQTLAQINIETISDSLFELFLNAKKQSDPAYTTDRSVATEELINMFILAQKARQEKLDKLRKVKEQLRFQKISLLAKLYLNKVKAETNITKAELELAYRKQYLERDNHQYKTRHIVLKDRKKAVALMRRLANNEDFATLARKYSIGPSASFGGALEWFRPDSVARKFAAAVQRLQKGETSRYPLKTKHGWHIILLEDVRKVEPPTLQQVYNRLYEDLKSKKINKHIKELRSLSNITINQTD